MNILVLCKRRYTNKDLIDDRFGRLYHFPRVWHEAGHPVTLLAADYFSFRNSVHDIDGMQFHSLAFPSLGFDYLHRLGSIARASNCELVIGSGDSHLGYIALRLAHKLSVPFVFDLYHHYADFGSNRIPGMKAMYYSSLRNADLVVVDSEPLRQKVSPWARRTLVATQGTDPQLFRPMPQHECRQQLGLDPGNKYIGYTGSLDSRLDYECLVQAMTSITATDSTIRLLVAGPNTSGYDMDLPFIDYLGSLPQQRIPVVINACDVMCIPYRATELASTCNPCKLSEYIFCARPLVASAVSNVMDYLTVSAERGYAPGDAAGLAKAIRRQLSDPLVEPADEALTWKTIGQRYLDALLQLTPARTA